MDWPSVLGWVVPLLFGAVFYGTYRYAKRDEPDVPPEYPAPGVRGWLLLLVGFMLIGPFIGAGRLFFELASVESEYPDFSTLESWTTFKSATWLSFLVVACLSFLAGYGLAKGRDMSVVRRAKVLLWVIGPVASLVLGHVIPLLVFGEFDFERDIVVDLAGSVVWSGLWTAYLSKSRRVLATYGGDRRETVSNPSLQRTASGDR